MMQQLLLRPLSKGALALLFVIAAIGFADATYLTVEHYVNAIPPCSIGSCETVLTSNYATVLGLPVSLFGSVFYFIVLILLMVYLDAKKENALRLATWLSSVGAIIAIILIGLMAFVIKAYCIYCLVSDILTIILCINFWVVLKKNRIENTTI